MWLPDRRLETPELLEPGRKPTGPVEVDWGKKITRGLRHCWLTDALERPDLVTGIKPTYFRAGSQLTYATVVDERHQGEAFYCNNNHLAQPATRYINTNQHADITGDISILMWMRLDYPLVRGGNDKYYEMFTQGSVFTANSDFVVAIRRSAATTSCHLVCYCKGPTTIHGTEFGDITWAVDEYHFIAWTWDTSDNIKCYVDGVEFGSATTARDTGGSFNVLFGGGSSPASNSVAAMDTIAMGQLYDRILSPTEVMSLYRDPYQFMIPA